MDRKFGSTRFNDPSRGALILIMHRVAHDDISGSLEPYSDYVLKLPLIAETREYITYEGRIIMDRYAGEPLNPARISLEEVEKIKARTAPHVFEGQYQQRPRCLDVGLLPDLTRLVRYSDLSSLRSLSCTPGTRVRQRAAATGPFASVRPRVAIRCGGKDRLYLIGIVRMQVELPEVREAISVTIGSIDSPSLIVMDGNGVGRGVYQDLLLGRGLSSPDSRANPSHDFRHRQPEDPPLQRSAFLPI